MLRWLLAAVHLLALGIGLGAVWVRARALQSGLDAAGLQRAFRADSLWGAAAFLWIGTGVWRLLAGLEKSTSYYVTNHVFLAKMGLLLVILILEVGPMLTLMRWRRASSPASLDVAAAHRIATISYVQAGLIVAMVFAATAVARGIGA